MMSLLSPVTVLLKSKLPVSSCFSQDVAFVAGVRRGREKGSSSAIVGLGEFEREARSWDWEGERLPWRYCFLHSSPSRLLVICYMSGCQNYPIRLMPLFAGKPFTARTRYPISFSRLVRNTSKQNLFMADLKHVKGKARAA